MIRLLGRGGFGEVWLAERQTTLLTTKVAVKLPVRESVDLGTVRQEAELWEQASGHPNVLPIIEANIYDGQVVIVSEYAPDGSLADLLKKEGHLSVEKSVEMIKGILSGLEFLHSRKIIHRDLKPANVLIQGDTPRLADFGISRALRTTQTSQSQTIAGTFEFMAPEAFDGKRNVQTDIWSAGVTFYKLLTGRMPFPQTEPTALVGAILMREPEPLPESIPPTLRNIVLRSLSKNPSERFESASQMRDALQNSASNVTKQKAEFTTLKLIDSTSDKNTTETVVHESRPKLSFLKSILKYYLVIGVLTLLFGVIIVPITIYINSNKRAALENQTFNNAIDANISKPVNSPVPSPSPSPTPTPFENIRVSLRLISQGASGCSVYPGETVILKTKGKTFEDSTNQNGVASFDNVPCGDTAEISAPNIRIGGLGERRFHITRQLDCKNSKLYLGSFGDLRGRQVGEKEANSCFKP